MRLLGPVGLSFLAAVSLAGAAPAAPGSCPFDLGPGLFAWTSGGKLRVLDLRTCRSRTLVGRGAAGASFSADGRFVAFSRGVVGTHGGPVFRSLNGVWAPRGHTQAAVTKSGGVVLQGPNLPGRRLLPDGWGAGSVAWAPSGEFLVLGRSSFSRPAQNSIWLYHLATGDTQLVAGVFPFEHVPVLATISPAADWVVWWRFYDHAASANADGVPLLAKRIAGDAGPLRVVPRILAAPEFLTWCRGRLVLAAGVDRYTTRGKRLLVSGPPVWKPRNVSPDARRSWTSPSCSLDGRRVAVSAGRNWIEPRFGLEHRSIWTVSLDRRESRRLTAPPRGLSDELPRWSGNGRAILFVRSGPTRGDTTARGSLYLVRLEGRPAVRIADLGATGNYYGRYGWFEQTDLFLPRVR